MDNTHAILLALLQGLTEFLPISSSAHLILIPAQLGWEDQGLAFDVAVHVGTLIAVVSYFRRDLAEMLTAWSLSLRNQQLNPNARLAWLVLLGTIPAALSGLLFHDVIETHLRSPVIIALATICFGLLLGWSDLRGRRRRDEHSLSVLDVLVIGVSQALALIPGTSRSGITMTAGLALGLTRAAAARFSFLLSIPLIAMAGAYEASRLIEVPGPVALDALLLGSIVAAISAYLCIHFFLQLIERIGMLPFVLYRLLLGGLLLWLAV